MDKKPVAIAIVIRDSDVLMVRRRNDANLLWQFPSGEIEAGETPDQAAVREVTEETGVKCEALRILGARIHPKTNRHVTYVACKWLSGVPNVGDPDELDRCEWVRRDLAKTRVPGGFDPSVNDYLVGI